MILNGKLVICVLAGFVGLVILITLLSIFEVSFFKKIKQLFLKCYSIEPLRFLFWGGINTMITYLFTQIIMYGIFEINKWNPTPIFANETNAILVEIGNKFSIPYIIAFVISIPISYTTNALFSFKQEWKFVRLLRYPLSSIPNFLLNLFGIWLFSIVLKWEYFVATFVAAILPLPIMFFVNRFLVSPIKIKKDKVEKEKIEEISEEK